MSARIQIREADNVTKLVQHQGQQVHAAVRGTVRKSAEFPSCWLPCEFCACRQRIDEPAITGRRAIQLDSLGPREPEVARPGELSDHHPRILQSRHLRSI